MLKEFEYKRWQAVEYASAWALSRNPRYLNFHGMGGDCTNFASQCVYAGCGVMNYRRDTGWYYSSPTNRAAAWSSVEYFFKFITTNRQSGPFGSVVFPINIQPGDIIQLGDENLRFFHSLVVTATGDIPSVDNILVCAHDNDAYYRPLNSYDIISIRYLHIEGYRKNI